MSIDGILGGLLGLLGVGISLWYSKKLNQQNQIFQEKIEKQNRDYDLWKKKYDVLVQMISYRYDVRSKEYSAAMNGVTATFYDSKKVIEATKKMYDYLSNTNSDASIANEKLIAIYSAMFEDLGIDQNIDESFLNKVFNG
ncbi:hypothetical protein JZO81_00375 [Enterococcus hulanensis]|uniref:DUF6680 family protein n=1 Tax=Enterococcus TaxID=1350 RepID=UPI000B5A29BC|nr:MULTISPECIES: DUF6680 family protein [Enterococcus]MBO0409486.1 hypothetical protein [Enterococcus hulanensis]OTO15347.1 hypothetical protein A5875_004505 [Enterococcus sp. 3H8_DIV0648]